MYYKVNYKPIGKELEDLQKRVSEENAQVKDKADHLVVEELQLHMSGFARELANVIEAQVAAGELPERAESVLVYTSRMSEMQDQPHATMSSQDEVPGVSMQSIIGDLRAILADLPTVHERLEELLPQVAGTTRGFKAIYLGIVAEDDNGELKHSVQCNFAGGINNTDKEFIVSVMDGHKVESEQVMSEGIAKLEGASEDSE